MSVLNNMHDQIKAFLPRSSLIQASSKQGKAKVSKSNVPLQLFFPGNDQTVSNFAGIADNRKPNALV